MEIALDGGYVRELRQLVEHLIDPSLDRRIVQTLLGLEDDVCRVSRAFGESLLEQVEGFLRFRAG